MSAEDWPEVPRFLVERGVEFLANRLVLDDATARKVTEDFLVTLHLVPGPAIPGVGEMVNDVVMLSRMPENTVLCHEDRQGTRVYMQVGKRAELSFFGLEYDMNDRLDVTKYLAARVVELPND